MTRPCAIPSCTNTGRHRFGWRWLCRAALGGGGVGAVREGNTVKRVAVLSPSERLTSQQIGDLVHARYRTGLTTLCGLPVGKLSRAAMSEAAAPTCEPCIRVAALWDPLDQKQAIA